MESKRKTLLLEVEGTDRMNRFLTGCIWTVMSVALGGASEAPAGRQPFVEDTAGFAARLACRQIAQKEATPTR